MPEVSLVIPCRNEVKYIGACLDSLLANDYPKEQLEVLVVDGMSDDGTRAVIQGYTKSYRFIRLIDNPRGVTPAGLNLGIASARGSEVMIWLRRSGADAVGGRCVARPGIESNTARAIAAAVSHPFGVGNSYFRTGVAEPRWVDTVPFGCYRRDVFDRVGLFDEELVRDQDDEFNQRILRHGGRLLLVPAIASQYYARESLDKLWRMFFQYGYFKPLVVRKVRGVMTARQLAPALLVCTMLGAALLSPWLGLARLLCGVGLAGYLATDLVVSTVLARRVGIRVALRATTVFPVLHFAYGVGYLLGVFDFLIRSKRPAPAMTLSR